MNLSNRKIGKSASELIASALLDGESVPMGAYNADFNDAILSAVEQGNELTEALRLFAAGELSAADCRAAIEKAADAYADSHEADWITARDAECRDDAIRARDEERLLRSA